MATIKQRRVSRITSPSSHLSFECLDGYEDAYPCLYWYQRPFWRWLLRPPYGITVHAWEVLR